MYKIYDETPENDIDKGFTLRRKTINEARIVCNNF
jgi:hypothetical protein